MAIKHFHTHSHAISCHFHLTHLWFSNVQLLGEVVLIVFFFLLSILAVVIVFDTVFGPSCLHICLDAKVMMGGIVLTVIPYTYGLTFDFDFKFWVRVYIMWAFSFHINHLKNSTQKWMILLNWIGSNETFIATTTVDKKRNKREKNENNIWVQCD